MYYAPAGVQYQLGLLQRLAAVMLLCLAAALLIGRQGAD
jgi:hypothetical protein